MTWPPSRSNFLLALAVGTCSYFLVGTIAGWHPDGAILGFSAAMWAAWDNEVLQERRRRQRRYRTERPLRRADDSEPPLLADDKDVVEEDPEEERS